MRSVKTMSSSSGESSTDLSLSCSFSDAETSASGEDSLESASDGDRICSSFSEAGGDISPVEDESHVFSIRTGKDLGNCVKDDRNKTVGVLVDTGYRAYVAKK